ncbi:hypothetical protein CLAFUW4_14073 [Fulvia fulva]|uniref:Uncharacterized protein n=1 Tax=Passalora fulva TaxID=5499 RepID=A0A9Q8PKV8_PASFU|nr:uncharacterized protein CLAFUR5_13911 [Fulvia fulva]KAK4610330.1 hypothetical protein CLAFUR4_14076 [Fulvia fulva]KAK4611229.1 hypothetical protein CLAFUR0_14080 [Fulvia fulva]UJO24381.1 hypothetical protein CLAFUR5_13911 [Fulvia fulva]WPV21822.1 hypothetical protein CLAFUW4_14073 [Fulvia fulva]WPV36837.1 hypothetical protein CLAFUW7_14084 [Fulvia fulva]
MAQQTRRSGDGKVCIVGKMGVTDFGTGIPGIAEDLRVTSESDYHWRTFITPKQPHPPGWMSRSQRHKANKRRDRKIAAEAAAVQKTQQNSTRPLLRIPPEVRLIIYEYAMIDNWTKRQDAMDTMLSYSSEGEDALKMHARVLKEKEAFRRLSAEPPALRVCRLIRSEGMKTYYQFLIAQKKRLAERASVLYSRVAKIMLTAPVGEWLDDDAESMAIVLDLIPDVEKEMKKLEHFGHAVADQDDDKDGQTEGGKVDSIKGVQDEGKDKQKEAGEQKKLDDFLDTPMFEVTIPGRYHAGKGEEDEDEEDEDEASGEDMAALDEAMLQMAVDASLEVP